MNDFTMLIKHLRDIVILTVTALLIVPWLLFRSSPEIIPGYLSIKILSMLLFMSGLSLFSWTVYLFQKIGRGTLAPWSPKSSLITSGPYRVCRNPMICGVLLMLIGEGLWFRCDRILTWAVIFFIINTLFLILREEPFLEKKFGDEYRSYKSRVPRWLPKI
ncbi:MAG: isoprenylcysteine carboxylmethyltransferase family protein [Saprospiraceae bacterium]|nr:isoprenylcysteine carboxylmethyltransferase family protein [Saprospiraceae bacterium]